MTGPPVSQEVAAALSRFYFGGGGPSHTQLTTAFTSVGLADVAPHNALLKVPNKQDRVRATINAAVRKSEHARELIDSLLVDLRVAGCFPDTRPLADEVRAAQRAFARLGWSLSADGYLSPAGGIDLSTGGRAALDEQLDRLRRATDDPGLLLGSAKDLLEAVAKFVLEEVGAAPIGRSPDFPELWHLARERLGLPFAGRQEPAGRSADPGRVAVRLEDR